MKRLRIVALAAVPVLSACNSPSVRDNGSLTYPVGAAVSGAVIGSQVADDGKRTEGAAVGALLGGLLGQVIAQTGALDTSGQATPTIPINFQGLWNSPGECQKTRQGEEELNTVIDHKSISPAYWIICSLRHIYNYTAQELTGRWECNSEEGEVDVLDFGFKATAAGPLARIKVTGQRPIEIPAVLERCGDNPY